MSGSISENEVNFVDMLKEADKIKEIISTHIYAICQEVGALDPDLPEGSKISALSLTATSLNLIHGAFVMLLSRQLQGQELEATDDVLQLATGLMNIAANQVVNNIPKLKNTGEDIFDIEKEPGDVTVH